MVLPLLLLLWSLVQHTFLKISKIGRAHTIMLYVDEAGIDNDDFYEYGWSLRGERL
jgi:hypothetical protein